MLARTLQNNLLQFASSFVYSCSFINGTDPISVFKHFCHMIIGFTFLTFLFAIRTNPFILNIEILFCYCSAHFIYCFRFVGLMSICIFIPNRKVSMMLRFTSDFAVGCWCIYGCTFFSFFLSMLHVSFKKTKFGSNQPNSYFQKNFVASLITSANNLQTKQKVNQIQLGKTKNKKRKTEFIGK